MRITYVRDMSSKNPAKRNKKVRIAIFASGRGSNAQSIYQYSLQKDSHFKVAAIISNKANAGVLSFAKRKKIASQFFGRNAFYNSETVIDYLRKSKIDMVVLAGFLWLVPDNIIKVFPKKILNIHPALLPNYGGKGMYGHHVHKAVHTSGDIKSGMTIHFVNNRYDEGQMIFQSQCLIKDGATPEDIASSVLNLEHHFYPQVIDGVASRLV